VSQIHASACPQKVNHWWGSKESKSETSEMEINHKYPITQTKNLAHEIPTKQSKNSTQYQTLEQAHTDNFTKVHSHSHYRSLMQSMQKNSLSQLEHWMRLQDSLLWHQWHFFLLPLVRFFKFDPYGAIYRRTQKKNSKLPKQKSQFVS